MKYLVLLSLLVSSNLYASKDRCPIASEKTSAGLWQAYNQEKGALYELEIREDGTSSLAASTLYGRVWLGESQRIEYINSGMSILFTSKVNPSEQVVVNGFGVSCKENGRLSLVLDGTGAGHVFRFQSINFYKYGSENMVSELKTIQKKIDEEKK